MKITKSYLMKHRTKRGAWTRVQLQALGVSFPPTKGWMGEVIGIEISPEQAEQFETGKSITAKIANKLSEGIDSLECAVDLVVEYQDKLGHEQIVKLAKVLGNRRGKNGSDTLYDKQKNKEV